jgi:MFS transporter, DHA2 family, methylenomycin A resistance protein
MQSNQECQIDMTANQLPTANCQLLTANGRPLQPKIGLTILATSLGFVLVQLDVSIVNIALAKIGADLGTPVAGVQWVVDSYALAFAALLLSAGAFGDQIGARKGFTIGFATFVAASFGCGLAPGPIALIVARTIQGLGAALLVPCSLALLNQAAAGDVRLRTRAISLWTAAGSVAMAVGPVLGGLLVDTLGWRSIFLINIPIGFVGIFLTQSFVQESATRHHTFDPAGQLLAILALLGLVGAVITSEGVRFSLTVWSALIIAAVSGAAFVFVESRVSTPMLPLDFFRQPTFTAATLIGLAVNFTLYGVIFVLGLYLQRIRGYSPLISGLVFLPFPIILLFSNLIAGWIARGANPSFVNGNRTINWRSRLLVASFYRLPDSLSADVTRFCRDPVRSWARGPLYDRVPTNHGAGIAFGSGRRSFE